MCESHVRQISRRLRAKKLVDCDIVNGIYYFDWMNSNLFEPSKYSASEPASWSYIGQPTGWKQIIIMIIIYLHLKLKRLGPFGVGTTLKWMVETTTRHFIWTRFGHSQRIDQCVCLCLCVRVCDIFSERYARLSAASTHVRLAIDVTPFSDWLWHLSLQYDTHDNDDDDDNDFTFTLQKWFLLSSGIAFVDLHILRGISDWTPCRQGWKVCVPFVAMPTAI